MERKREPLLSDEDIARLRTKYPSRKKSLAVDTTKLKRHPLKLSGDYKSLRLAVSDIRLPVVKASLDSYSVIFVANGAHVSRGHWILLAWTAKYGKSPAMIIWLGRRYDVKEYIVDRNGPIESKQMLVWWKQLLDSVPEGYPVVPIPTDEELVLQWKELEERSKGSNQ